jgi:hypothetical protein
MTLEEIKTAVDNGESVYWATENYRIIKDKLNQYLIHSQSNDYYIGLTWRDGVTMNGDPEQFFKA